MDDGKLTVERYDKDSVRIMRGGEVVGMISRHCDDLWSVNDTRDQRLTKRRFTSPARALKFVREKSLLANADA